MPTDFSDTSHAARAYAVALTGRYAKAHSIDLITMGRHGRGGIKPVLLGSVAEGVVQGAACAVLSVRLPQRSAA